MLSACLIAGLEWMPNLLSKHYLTLLNDGVLCLSSILLIMLPTGNFVSPKNSLNRFPTEKGFVDIC